MRFYKDAFKLLRESKCLTLEEIGKRVGVSKPTVQKWETGVAKPRPANVYALAKVLEISVVDISDLRPEKWLTDTTRQYPANPKDRLLQFVLEEWGNLSATAKDEIVAVVERDKKDRNETGNYTQKQA